MQITGLRLELEALREDNSPWLQPRTAATLRPLSEHLRKVTSDHIEAMKSDDEARIRESRERLSVWIEKDLAKIQSDLDDEARRIIGTKRHWNRTW